MSAIEIESLSVHYEKASVLSDLSVTIPKGVLCGIAGPNGAGKSTLLQAIMGLIRPLSGRVSFLEGQSLFEVRQKIAYVPQRESVDWDFPITVFDVALMGRAKCLGLFGRPRRADRDAAIRALEKVGLADYQNRQISQLSGGQQQRLFLARALIQEPEILLLDEPFAGIDLATEKAIFELLRSMKKKGSTILIVFHDLQNAEKYFDRLLLLNRRLIAYGPVSEIYVPSILARAFGKRQPLYEEAAHLFAKTQGGFE